MGACKGSRIRALACAALLACGPVNAQDCVRPAGFPESLPCPSQPFETVLQEHEDRIGRLKRLSINHANFAFSTTTLTRADHRVPGFPVDIPVLRVVADADVFFDTDQSVIREEAMPIIYIIAESLKREPPDVSLFVAGHTDSRASEEYNLALGNRRAQAVAAALVRRGVYQASIYSVSFGEYAPIASNATAAGRAKNRRVEFLFSARSEAIVETLQRQEVHLCSDRDSGSSSNCRVSMEFVPSRIELAVGQTQAVLQDEARREEILSDRNLKPMDVERELKALEVKADRREITISDTKIEIQLGSE